MGLTNQSCSGASADSFSDGEVLTHIQVVTSPGGKSWLLSRPSCFSLSCRFCRSGTQRNGVAAIRSGSVAAAQWSGVERGQNRQVSVDHRGKCRPVHGSKNGLASGASSDGRVNRATLAPVRAAARRSEARAERSIHDFGAKRADVVFGREKLGGGGATCRQPGAACPPPPRVSAKSKLLRSTNHGGGGC
jgi:hypothetical protein